MVSGTRDEAGGWMPDYFRIVVTSDLALAGCFPHQSWSTLHARCLGFHNGTAHELLFVPLIEAPYEIRLGNWVKSHETSTL